MVLRYFYQKSKDSFDVLSMEGFHGVIESIIYILPIMVLAVLLAPRADVNAYVRGFKLTSSETKEFVNTLKLHGSGFGFGLFSIAIKSIFGNNILAFRSIIFIVHSTVFVVFFRKYSTNYGMSLFLFLAFGCHFAWLMNGLRQFMAVSIVLFAVPYVLKNEILRPVLIVLLAITFHSSAIIMLPVIFSSKGKPWNKRTTILLFLCVVFAYLFNYFSGLLDYLLSKTEYSNLMSNAREYGDDGTNPVRVLVASIPCIIAFIGRKQLEEVDDTFMNYCVNMSIVTTGIYIISMVTSGVMIGRLPIYTNIFNFVLLPYEIKTIFTPRTARVLYIFIGAFYFVYYIYGYGRYH